MFARRLNDLNETKSLCADPEKCLVVEGDVTSEDDVVRLFKDAVNKFGTYAPWP